MIPDSEAADVDSAVAAAKSALPSWSKTSKEHRSALLNKLADLLEANLESFGTYLYAYFFNAHRFYSQSRS
jgi:acyl-CoA reductase-like NAD-dependent aldehyde dehydrogenase